MTDSTETDLGTRVLQELGFLDEGETPSANALAFAIQTSRSEIALMAAKNLPIWNGSGVSVPIEYLTTLARRIALAVAPSYGLTDLATAQQAMRAAEADLRVLAARPATGERATTEYF